MSRRRKDYRLLKVVVAVVVVGGAAFAVSHLWTGFREGRLSLGGKTTREARVAQARELLAEGKIDEARELLGRIVARAGKGADASAASVLEQALRMLADVEQQAGNGTEAKRCLERIYREFPNSPDHADMAVAYAGLLATAGDVDEAKRVYQDVCDNAPRELRAPALMGLGRMAEESGELDGQLGAREFYRQAAADAGWDSAIWNEALDALGRINVALVFSPRETPECKRYIVKPGDSITSIGNALNTTQGLLMRANGITETSILSIGRQLKYTPKDFRVVIERSRLRLFVLDNEGIFKRYAVGLGKPGRETTLGAYKIGSKQKDPVWFKPNEGPIPAGDPRNELGTRWMPLVPDAEGLPKDLGIHGTIAPETIGKYSSNGCCRLRPHDIEELYDLVVRSTPVDIVETFQLGQAGHAPDESLAAAP